MNTKVYQFNGTLAASNVFAWDLSTPAAINSPFVNGINAQTTLYAGTSPAAFFNLGASLGTLTLAGGDPVVLMAGTGNPPANFTPWVAGTLQTAAVNVYFTRDVQLVSGQYYFNLASTSGGAAITPTTSTSNFTMIRAFGACTIPITMKTGTLPAFTLGVILQNNSVGYAKPVSAPANTALNGQDCLYMMTSTGLYMGKITDLSNGSSTWASMTFSGINITGTGIDITTPTFLLFTYSWQNQENDIYLFIYATGTATYVVKPYQASNISVVFGGQNDAYYETLNPVTVQAAVVAVSGLNCENGWLFITSNTIGQRGIIFLDLYSDTMFGSTQVISPVLNVPAGTVFKYLNTLEQLFDYTDSMNFFIRSASTSGDALFSSATGGWTQVHTAADLSATAIGPYFQLMATFQIATLDANTPAQLNDFEYTVVPANSISDYWEGSVDNTSANGVTPTYTAFRLTQAYGAAYGSVVPTLYFRAYDDSGNLVVSANTASNPTFFNYTTTNGASWNSLGTVPNTALTTEVRYQWTSPPGVRVTCSLREF